MVWEWSHTAEAYENARQQIAAQDRDWLAVCWAEIQARGSREDYPDGFNSEAYETALKHSASLASDDLADAIWDFSADQRDCTNGGWAAHCCPWGCHTVPFDPVEEPA